MNQERAAREARVPQRLVAEQPGDCRCSRENSVHRDLVVGWCRATFVLHSFEFRTPQHGCESSFQHEGRGPGKFVGRRILEHGSLDNDRQHSDRVHGGER